LDVGEGEGGEGCGGGRYEREEGKDGEEEGWSVHHGVLSRRFFVTSCRLDRGVNEGVKSGLCPQDYKQLHAAAHVVLTRNLVMCTPPFSVGRVSCGE